MGYATFPNFFQDEEKKIFLSIIASKRQFPKKKLSGDSQFLKKRQTKLKESRIEKKIFPPLPSLPILLLT